MKVEEKQVGFMRRGKNLSRVLSPYNWNFYSNVRRSALKRYMAYVRVTLRRHFDVNIRGELHVKPALLHGLWIQTQRLLQDQEPPWEALLDEMAVKKEIHLHIT
jgi:hypothetical protein